MKLVLILLSIVTFTACQYKLEVESQNSFEDIAEINDQIDNDRDVPDHIPVIIQYETSPGNNDVACCGADSFVTESEASEEVSLRPDRQKLNKNEDGDAYIVKYSNINNGFEGYQFGYETSNGISRNEQLTFRDIDEENQVADIKGGYQFTDPLGRTVVVKYTAGVDGFKPIIQYL